MDDKIFDRINDVDLIKTMETSYIDYAMSTSRCKRRVKTSTKTCPLFNDRA